jgi:outer membrane protein
MKQTTKRIFAGNKKWLIAVIGIFLSIPAHSQQVRYLPLEEAIRLGLSNSKQLAISRKKVDEAINQYKQAEDLVLPSMKASYGGSEAIIPNRRLVFGPDTLYLPHTAPVFMGTLSVEEPLFQGNRLRYAKQSAELLQKVASLDTSANRNQIAFDIVNSYYTLVKVEKNQQIVSQNINDIEQRLKETKQFEQQGLATENDVLRWEFQLSNARLSGIELENNRKITNYNLNIMLGLPDSTEIQPDSTVNNPELNGFEDDYIAKAFSNRSDLQEFSYRIRMSDVDAKKLKDGKLPTVGVGLNGYYINPTKKFFPASGTFIDPFTIGLTIGWNISSLYTTKNKMEEINIQKQETQLAQQDMQDNIKKEVNQDYRTYLLSLDRIKVLRVAVDQAQENDRIMESKYQNQLANTTDRIDAETMLYQAKINLQLAQVDAQIAYYNLIKSTGTLQ